MKFFFIALVFFYSGSIAAQKDSSDRPSIGKRIRIDEPAVAERLIQMKDSLLRVNPEADRVEIREGLSDNVRELIHEQKKNEKRRRNGALIRIGIGIAMFVLLIYGLMRKSKRRS